MINESIDGTGSFAMKCLLQRVTEAAVHVEGALVGQISHGLLVFVGIERDDGPAQLQRMAERVLGYRVFADEQGRMNCSLRDTHGLVGCRMGR